MNRRLAALVAMAIAGCALYSDVLIVPLTVQPANIEHPNDLNSMIRKADLVRAVQLAPSIEAKHSRSARQTECPQHGERQESRGDLQQGIGQVVANGVNAPHPGVKRKRQRRNRSIEQCLRHDEVAARHQWLRPQCDQAPGEAWYFVYFSG